MRKSEQFILQYNEDSKGRYIEYVIKSPLFGENIVLVDESEVPLINSYTWHFNRRNSKLYVTTSLSNPRRDMKLYRIIMDVVPYPHIHIDHINSNTLNNRKYNLRKATFAENVRNTGCNSRSTTGYKGVYMFKEGHKSNGLFTAALVIDGRKIFGGYFKTAEEAALKYNELSLKYHGEFGYKNIIK